MEALLFAFIEHGANPALFSQMEEELAAELGARRMRRELM